MGEQDFDKMINLWFTYHPPTPEQIPLYENIRSTAKILASVFVNCCPENTDRYEALLLLRKAVMMANASIACQE